VTRPPRALALLHALVLAATLAPAAGAQDPRLEARVEARTRAQLAPILDSARRAGLPVEPLIDKALEGATKGASRPRIVGAVRTLATTLGAARGAIGRGASEAEIVAAADALEAGVRPRELGALRALRQSRPITVPLAVLADLVARGVPPDTAARSVLDLARVGAADAQFVALRIDVERDIGSGIAPAMAVVMRSEASIRAHGPDRSALKNPVAGQVATPATP
jgi:hypothetical protein